MKKFYTALLIVITLLTLTGTVASADGPVGADCTDPPNPVPFADLVNCDLSGMDMQGVNIWSADLSGALLEGVDFTGANATGAIFDNADMFTTILTGATFDNASLRDTNMEGAYAPGGSFIDADLRGADLYTADFRNADVSGANFSGNYFNSFDLPGAWIRADAGDPDGSVTKVEFYADGVLLNTDTSAPYNYYWYPTSRGTQTLTAKAYDDGGAETTSDPVTVRVR